MDMPTPDGAGVYLEKPTIAAIAAGIPVLRSDFSLVQAEMQGRFDMNINMNIKKEQP